jgi:alpha-tubulin suppressor-like RCC1 family protein
VQVNLPANHVAKSVSVSGYTSTDSAHSCAILEELVESQRQHRGIYCWGENQSGQLGRGSVTVPRADSQATPQGVSGLSGPNGSEVYAVAVGGAHTCAILKPSSEINGGAVRCWGANSKGQLGDGTTQNNAAPVTTIGFSSAGAQGLALGAEHTCVVTNVGTVQCWGQNDVFQLGVQHGPNGEKFGTQPVTVPNLSGVVGIAAGDKHTCVLLNNGNIKCWGSNSSGQLGNGNSGGYTETPSPVTGSVITSGERAVAVSAGGSQTCALLESGGVKCWGANTQGQLGDGSNSSSNTAVDVQDLANQALAVEIGAAHTCILKNTGGIACFGSITPTGLQVPQRKPVNNVMPQPLASPAIPSAQFRNCRVLRSIDL